MSLILWQGWMNHACSLARQALPEDVPVAAVVLDANFNNIGSAYNCRERDNNPMGHAELLALEQAGKTLQNWRLNNCTLLVTLEPCPMCMAAIIQARIRTVVFGTPDSLLGACGSRYNLVQDQKAHIQIIGGIEEAACKTLLTDFFKKIRAKG